MSVRSWKLVISRVTIDGFFMVFFSHASVSQRVVALPGQRQPQTFVPNYHCNSQLTYKQTRYLLRSVIGARLSTLGQRMITSTFPLALLIIQARPIFALRFLWYFGRSPFHSLPPLSSVEKGLYWERQPISSMMPLYSGSCVFKCDTSPLSSTRM